MDRVAVTVNADRDLCRADIRTSCSIGKYGLPPKTSLRCAHVTASAFMYYFAVAASDANLA